MTAEIQPNVDHAVGRILEKKLPIFDRLARDGYEKRDLVVYSFHPFGTAERVGNALGTLGFETGLMSSIYFADFFGIKRIS